MTGEREARLAEVLAGHQRRVDNGACWCGAWPNGDGETTWMLHVAQAIAADERDVAAEAVGCGGCAGLGAHQRYCPKRPGYHPWLRLADMAETIGDGIGSNDIGIANRAYSLSGDIKALIADRARPQLRRSTGDQP